MKTIITLSLLFMSVGLFSQTTAAKPPKLRYTTGFFSTKWELGDKDVTPPEIQLHLDKNDNEAAYNFRRARALSLQSSVFSLLGAVGILVGVFTDDTVSLVGYGAGVAFSGISIGTGIASKSKYDKAVNGYNKKFGY